MNYVQFFLHKHSTVCRFRHCKLQWDTPLHILKPVTQMDTDHRVACASWRRTCGTDTTIAITGPESGKELNFHRRSNVDRIVTYPASDNITFGASWTTRQQGPQNINAGNTSHRVDPLVCQLNVCRIGIWHVIRRGPGGRLSSKFALCPPQKKI